MQSIEEKKHQNDVIVKTCYTTDIVYLGIRLLCMIIFFIANAFILAYVSLGSIIIYLLFSLLIKNKKYYLYALGCGFEFILYSSIATILCGFAAGFYLNIIGLSIVSFFTVYFSLKERKIGSAVTWTIMSIFICLGLHIYCSLVEPYYHFEKWVTTVFFGIHIIIVFSFIIGYLMIFTKYALTLENKIKNESRVDQLTKVSNRYDLFNYLESIEDKSNYSLAILDIDDFKKINDTYGHICGDYILKEIAKIAKLNSDNSFVSRYGGEEFIVIVKTDGNKDIAYNILERIRTIIENNNFIFENQNIKITISVGIETYHDDILNEKWIDLADEKLYVSKGTGKNKITM